MFTNLRTEDLGPVVKLNVLGAFKGMQHRLRGAESQGHGRIVRFKGMPGVRHKARTVASTIETKIVTPL